jgi:thymidylate synthase (FAD)
VKLPIFVARQWIRHRTANVNEYSARYSILDNEFYIPARSTGRAVGHQPPGPRRLLEGDEARACRTCCARTRAGLRHYLEMLNEDDGRRAARPEDGAGRAWRANWRA